MLETSKMGGWWRGAMLVVGAQNTRDYLASHICIYFSRELRVIYQHIKNYNNNNNNRI